MNDQTPPDDSRQTSRSEASKHPVLDAPKIPFPPAIYPVSSIAGGYFLQRFIPLPQPSDTSFTIIGSVIFVISILLLVWSITTLRKFKTTTMPHHPAKYLVTTGPYRFSRNPIYLAFLLLTLASALATGNLWILLSLPVVMLTLAIYAVHPEESHLKQTFGDSYIEYSRKVRRWI